MEFDSDVVKFNIYDTTKYHTDLSYTYNIAIINSLNQKYFDLSYGDEVNIALCNTLNVESLRTLEEDYVADQYL